MEFWHCKSFLLYWFQISLCAIYSLIQYLYLKSHQSQILLCKWQTSKWPEDWHHCQLAHQSISCSKSIDTLHPLSFQPRCWIPCQAYSLLPICSHCSVSLHRQPTTNIQVGSAQNVLGLHSINICCGRKGQYILFWSTMLPLMKLRITGALLSTTFYYLLVLNCNHEKPINLLHT